MAETARPLSGAPAALRTYLELASGLGDASRKQVRKVVKELIGKGNATAEQVKAMTGELLAANTASREALGKLVKSEVDRALSRVGLATLDEVNELNTRVHDLERQLRDARRAATADLPSATLPGGTASTPSPSGAQTSAKAGKKAAKKSAGKAAKAADSGKPAARSSTAVAAKAAAPRKAVRKVSAAAAPATTPVRKAARRTLPAEQAGKVAKSSAIIRPAHSLREGER